MQQGKEIKLSLFPFLTRMFLFVPSPWSVSFINDRLTGLEKTFLNPEGLPGRPLYWYVVTKLLD